MLDSKLPLGLIPEMGKWRVSKYVKENGRCPVDNWLDSNAVTENDIAALDARIVMIEAIDGQLPPETLKKYHGTDFKELKVRGDKKQLRPLCIVVPERHLIILCGAIEKGGKLPKGDISKASHLVSELKEGKGRVEDYFKD